jgi:hypothetical protein
MLERKLDVETRARAVDSKVMRKKELEMREQVSAVSDRMEFMEIEYRVISSKIEFILKEKEQELRAEIHRLKNALNKK